METLYLLMQAGNLTKKAIFLFQNMEKLRFCLSVFFSISHLRAQVKHMFVWAKLFSLSLSFFWRFFNGHAILCYAMIIEKILCYILIIERKCYAA